MEGLRVEIGMKHSSKTKLVRSGLKWTADAAGGEKEARKTENVLRGPRKSETRMNNKSKR